MSKRNMPRKLSKKNQRRLSTIGIYLKQWRLGEGMTRKDVCQHVPMHHHTLMAIEAKREKGYNIIHIFELADFFGVSPKEILEIAED